MSSRLRVFALSSQIVPTETARSMQVPVAGGQSTCFGRVGRAEGWQGGKGGNLRGWGMAELPVV